MVRMASASAVRRLEDEPLIARFARMTVHFQRCAGSMPCTMVYSIPRCSIEIYRLSKTRLTIATPKIVSNRPPTVQYM